MGIDKYNDECRAIVRALSVPLAWRHAPVADTCLFPRALPVCARIHQVMRYSSEWRSTVERMGRWIDFDNDYKTLDPTFMESV